MTASHCHINVKYSANLEYDKFLNSLCIERDIPHTISITSFKTARCIIQCFFFFKDSFKCNHFSFEADQWWINEHEHDYIYVCVCVSFCALLPRKPFPATFCALTIHFHVLLCWTNRRALETCISAPHLPFSSIQSETLSFSCFVFRTRIPWTIADNIVQWPASSFWLVGCFVFLFWYCFVGTINSRK